MLSATIVFLIKENKKERDEKKELNSKLEEERKMLLDAIASGVCSLLRERMKSIYQDVISKDYINSTQREIWDKCFKSYHKLGGNGIIKDMNDEIREVQIKDK